MTISTTYFIETYTINGVGPYAFNWELIGADTLVVAIDDEIIDASQYTVALTGTAPIYSGGTITLLNTLATGELKIFRVTPQDQNIDLVDYGPFPANTVEFGFDKLTLIAQEIAVNGGGGGGPGPTPGDFLPLSGGTMDPDAFINFGTTSTSGAGRIGMLSLLGVPAFVIQPTAQAPDMGLILQIDDAATKYMAASVDGTWALFGRPDFASLPDNAIATKADVATGGGQFLPLAGGTMDNGAVITWGTDGAGGAVGLQTFSAVFGAPGFIWQPDTGSQDQGYVFAVNSGLTKYLAASVDGTWAIEGRPAYSGLGATAVAIKEDVDARINRAGDTWDQGVTQVFPRDPTATDTTDAEMAFINFFGINALRIQAAVPNTLQGIGYLLLTDEQNVVAPFLVGSKSSGFRIRNQIFSDPDDIVTVDYLTNNTLADAPADGTEYVRKDAAWVPNTGGSGGEVNTNSNAGTGEGLVLPKVGVDTPIKSLKAGTDVTLTPDADSITIAFTGGGAGVAWGSITGTLSDQTDLQNALNAKFNKGGDTWTDGAVQLFPTPSSLPAFSGGSMQFADFLGIPGWLWGPQAGGGTAQVGYLWDTTTGGTGPALGGNPTDGFEIRDQVLGSGESIITRALGDGRYAPLSHTHTIAQVTGLQAELDNLQTQINGKAPSSAVNTATWGSINGTLSNQSDLLSALNARTERAVNEVITGIWTFPGFTATVGVNLQGGSINNGARVQGVGTPVAGPDATNKTYVDAAVSDIRVKDILSVPVNSERIYDLEIFAYEYRRDVVEFPLKPNFRAGVHYGPSAQQMQIGIPEGVYASSLGDDLLDIDRDMLLMLTLNEVQKLRAELDEVKT